MTVIKKTKKHTFRSVLDKKGKKGSIFSFAWTVSSGLGVLFLAIFFFPLSSSLVLVTLKGCVGSCTDNNLYIYSIFHPRTCSKLFKDDQLSFLTSSSLGKYSVCFTDGFLR